MDIIYFSNTLWHSLRQRPQQIALALSKKNRVLFVEPATNIFSLIKSNKNNNNFFHIKNTNLFILKAIPTLPFKNYFSFLNKYYQNKVYRTVKKIIKNLEFSDMINWLTFPSHAPLIGKFNEKFLIYECMDEYVEFEKTYKRSLLNRYEEEIIDNADLIIVTSDALLESKKRHSKKIFLSTNAAEVEYFEKVVNGNFEKLRIFSNENPVIGYIGIIQQKLDYELIENLIKNNPFWNFLFIGPIRTDISQIEKYNNVKFTNYIPYSELLPYLKTIDIAIVPFSINKMTENINPIKIYEFIAAGKPVVSTPFPEAKKFTRFVNIASGYKEFTIAISKELKENSNEKISLRLAFVKKHNWQERANVLEEKIIEMQQG